MNETSFDFLTRTFIENIELATDKGIIRTKPNKALFIICYLQSDRFLVDWELRSDEIIIPSDPTTNVRGLIWIKDQLSA